MPGAGATGVGSSNCFAMASSAALPSMCGSAGSAALGVAKSKQVLRSPATARRQGLMLGSITPKRVSRKRTTEVWSATCELTQPPRLQGDTTYIGTRQPMPKGEPR